jgi:putative membrane-bound dehydrogenase-like protein
MCRFSIAIVLGLWTLSSVFALGQEPAQDQIPHAQDRPPNPPKSPDEALTAMTVPPGFQVELVASEPDLVNPVAMTFDERGRIWVTESLEYPRREPGPGRDRIRVLDDTDGDGRADSFQTFAEGLNIPSGVAVGHGGVWVANSPDILFIPDADRDARADGPPEIVATGFGRDDTHELPNSLTWGPDGWLYGWNGVFNPSRVASNNGKTYAFTCAIWRIHPKTREFQVWCEGTSNPWGIAINEDGAFFSSACVIDHLWHLVEGAYYLRQGGPYPPHTWPMRSIVDHSHQKAAYCGITWFDSPAYPAEYRARLYMGNIHGNCINVDVITRTGSSYRAVPAADFLAANDAWFMPVSQKTGPDGCLYILDWYDRYHCYQDANRDPGGIDRLKGRLYRIHYRDVPRRAGFDLAKTSDGELIDMLASENVYDRETAQRLLSERLARVSAEARTRPALSALALDATAAASPRRHALWALIGAGPLEGELHRALVTTDDDVLRAWGVRAAGDRASLGAESEPAPILSGLDDSSPAVRLQAVVAAAKAFPEPDEQVRLLLHATSAGDDRLLSHVKWQKLLPLLDDPRVVESIDTILPGPSLITGSLETLWPRIVDHAASNRRVDGELFARLVQHGIRHLPAAGTGQRDVIESVARSIRQGTLQGERLGEFRNLIGPVIGPSLDDDKSPLHASALHLAAVWGDPQAIDRVRARFASPVLDPDQRLEALATLVAVADPRLLETLSGVLEDPSPASKGIRGPVLSALGPLENPRVADIVLAAFDQLEPAVRPRAVELLTERPAWTHALLAAIEAKSIPPSALDVNQIRRLQQSKAPEIAAFVRKTWGRVRPGRNAAREQVVARMRQVLGETPGDPFAGRLVFQRLCAQCHKIYGEGQEVGPEITSNGRNDFDQLISNVFDPNIVIGPAYQAVNVALRDGRILTGLLVEDSRDRITLTLQGGKRETIERAELEEVQVSGISLMPEEIETQLAPQEIADLFAFLALDKPPEEPTARRLPGAPAQVRAGAK